MGRCFLAAEVISKDTNSDAIKARGQRGCFNEGSTGLRGLDLAGGQQRKGEGGKERGWGTRLHFSQKLNMAEIEFAGWASVVVTFQAGRSSHPGWA